jgi:putative salt-induced outer membrane protein
MLKHLLAIGLIALPMAAPAMDWQPSAEAGVVATSGNSDTLNVNGRFALAGKDESWIHDYYALALRNETDSETTANRYEFGGRSGWKFGERSYMFGALRYENDDFSTFDYQTIASIGYGVFAIQSEATTLLFEIGPGYRWAKFADDISNTDDPDGAVLRGLMDFKHRFTASTSMFDTMVVEAGSDNTFVQNDLGILVSMTQTLALKAAFQVRHNTESVDGADRTDTLTTLNLVWTPGAPAAP